MYELAPPIRSEQLLAGSLPLMRGQLPTTVLLRALWVLRDPNRWIRYFRAVDACGVQVEPNDPTATRWCTEGAIAMSSNPWGVLAPFFMKLLDEIVLEQYKDGGGINCLEGYCAHSSVVRVLKAAITRAEELYGDGRGY